MELKIHCDCGQKYKFDVEPVNHQMPFAVTCPICQRDGTAKANALLQQMQVFKPIGTAPVETPPAAAPPPLPSEAPADTPPPFTGPKASPPAPVRIRLATPTPAATQAEPAIAPPPIAPAGVVLPPTIGRTRTADPGAEGAKKTSFGMGVLGGFLGALIGAIIYYFIFKTTGVRAFLALGVGALAGIGAAWLGKGEGSKELGGITAVFVIVGVLAAQYLVILGIWNNLIQDTLDAGYSSAVAEAREIVKAVPAGSDEEIKMYLARQSADEGEAVKPAEVSAEEVKALRDHLPEYQDLASGKISKDQYLISHGHDLDKLKKLQNTQSDTFKGLFMLLTLNLRSIISLVLGAGVAFKLSTNA